MAQNAGHKAGWMLFDLLLDLLCARISGRPAKRRRSYLH